jgi:hypothetical protein
MASKLEKQANKRHTKLANCKTIPFLSKNIFWGLVQALSTNFDAKMRPE